LDSSTSSLVLYSHFELPAAEQTARLLRAMDHKHFSILAHPTGRLLRQREMSRLDIDRVIGAAKDRGCFLEINSQPDRLDLADTYCRTAKTAGVLLSIGSDAHSTDQLDFLEFGVLQARRGWLRRAISSQPPLRRSGRSWRGLCRPANARDFRAAAS
jgi:DNA polymerase (family 10)